MCLSTLSLSLPCRPMAVVCSNILHLQLLRCAQLLMRCFSPRSFAKIIPWILTFCDATCSGPVALTCAGRRSKKQVLCVFACKDPRPMPYHSCVLLPLLFYASLGLQLTPPMFRCSGTSLTSWWSRARPLSTNPTCTHPWPGLPSLLTFCGFVCFASLALKLSWCASVQILGR